MELIDDREFYYLDHTSPTKTPGRKPFESAAPRAIYEPPYDSPIEDGLAYHLVKYIHVQAKLCRQFQILQYRLDFLIEIDGRAIGIECDGRRYHNWIKDMERDGAILAAAPDIAAIYRFPGSAIYAHLEDALFGLANHEPGMFSHRGATNLETLASIECRDAIRLAGEQLGDFAHWDYLKVSYPPEFSRYYGPSILYCRHSRWSCAQLPDEETRAIVDGAMRDGDIQTCEEMRRLFYHYDWQQ